MSVLGITGVSDLAWEEVSVGVGGRVCVTTITYKDKLREAGSTSDSKRLENRMLVCGLVFVLAGRAWAREGVFVLQGQSRSGR